MRFGINYEPDESDEEGRNESVEKLKAFIVGKWDARQRKIILMAGIGLLVFCFYCSGILVSFGKHGAQGLGKNPVVYLLTGIFSIAGWLYTLLLFLVITVVVMVLKKKNGELDAIKGTDDRGVNYSQAGTYGTAEWMSREQAAQEYEITNIDKAQGVILGQYGMNGEEVIALPKDTKGNRNVLILGSPGTGKSFCYVRNAVFQAIVRGESVVITDPKGELFESCAGKLREEGYKVKVFNLVNPQRSDSWNCLSEIYDPETGNISDVRVTEFCDTVMRNTAEGADDLFWSTGENNLLKAIVMFCAWRREEDLKVLYEAKAKELYASVGEALTIDEQNHFINAYHTDRNHPTMNDRERVLKRLLELAYGEESEKILKEIRLKAAPCDTASIYHLIVTSDIKELENKFKVVPISHPAGIAWSIFKNGSDNVRPGIVQGLAQRLQLFQMRDIRRITTNDDIVLEKLGEDKTALFCIISDKSTAMRALTSLFFTFLFKDVADAADRYGPKNRLFVNVICDEFANLGTIPSFDVTISTVRSRKINISIILQSVMQLTKNYGDAGETIISCCDTILFLGCNDSETANFVSDLSGLASIRVISTKDSRNSSLGYRAPMQGYSIGEGDGKRNLMNPDEVRRLPRDDVLIYHNGCNILQAHRCGYILHKFYREGLPPEERLSDYPLASLKYSISEATDAFLQADYEKMNNKNKSAVRVMAQEKENTEPARQNNAVSAEPEPPEEKESDMKKRVIKDPALDAMTKGANNFSW